MTALPPVSKSGSSTGADFANYLSIRSEKYGLSLYISREKGDHHYIQTWHKDRFSHYNLILKKLQEKMSGNVLKPPGHPIILPKSNKFNMATVSVKRSIKITNCT